MSNLEAPEDAAYEAYRTRRLRRVRVTAWVVIIALIATGGGSAIFALLFP